MHCSRPALVFAGLLKTCTVPRSPISGACFWIDTWKQKSTTRRSSFRVSVSRYSDVDTVALPHFNVSRSFQVTGDVHVQGAIVLWKFLLQINVRVLDHLKRTVVRKE